MSCNNKIIKLYLPASVITNGASRATSIKLKLAGPNCCRESNVVTIPIPPIPPPDPGPAPDKCLEQGSDLIGHIVKVSYDRTACGGSHGCNRALFDLYINDIWIGQANLNNGGGPSDPGGAPGGYRESIFTIKDSIIANPGFKIELRCAYKQCHSGIGRVGFASPTTRETVFAACLKTDSVVTSNILCPSLAINSNDPTPTPTKMLTPTPTPTKMLTPTPTSTLPTTVATNIVAQPAWNSTLNYYAIVNWTPPTSNDDSTIVNYIVQYRQLPSSQWYNANTGTSSNPSSIVRDLIAGQSYVWS